jgi:hypothetical protein
VVAAGKPLATTTKPPLLGLMAYGEGAAFWGVKIVFRESLEKRTTSQRIRLPWARFITK